MEDTKIRIASGMITSGTIKTFRDIFLYVSKTEMSKQLGMNYTRFRELVNNPIRFRYDETYRLAKILQVEARVISVLIHNQIDAAKPNKTKSK